MKEYRRLLYLNMLTSGRLNGYLADIEAVSYTHLGNTLQLVFAVLLLILGVLVAIQGVKKLLEKTDDKKATA